VNALQAVVVIGVLMVAVPGAAADPTPVPVPRAQATALADELRLHPEAAADDAYKFLHQGVFGPGHAVDDRQSAERLLDQEIAGLAPAAVEDPLCQPLGGPTPMARIHLRPFLAAGGYPAVGHSERYRNAFKPAYRVVVLELARAKGWCP